MQCLEQRYKRTTEDGVPDINLPHIWLCLQKIPPFYPSRRVVDYPHLKSALSKTEDSLAVIQKLLLLRTLTVVVQMALIA